MAKVIWTGPMPAWCDICRRALTNFFVDGRTQSGRWANMCQECHAFQGVGLGTGKGQKYNRTTGEKVEG